MQLSRCSFVFLKNMKRYHAAALTLVVWYLMTAPVSQTGGAIDQDAPLSEWKKTQTFDSESDCADQRREAIRDSQDAVTIAPDSVGDESVGGSIGGNEGDAKKDAATALDKAVASRCVADDDPNLINNSLTRQLGPGLLKKMLH
jgi:hypothetical protein